MPSRVHLRWAAAALAPLAVLSVPAPASAGPPAPPVSVAVQAVDLGTLGGETTFAAAINAAGQVAGNSRTVTGEIHAFFWSDGAITDLGVAPGGTSSSASAITDDGTVLGDGDSATGAGPFVWKAGVRTEIVTTDLGPARAIGINNAGTVIGVYRTQSGQERGFRWRGGQLTDLGTLVPARINDAGVIVGTEDLGGGNYRVLRRTGTVSTDLGTFAGPVGQESPPLVVDLTERGDIALRTAVSDGDRSYVRRAGTTAWRALPGLRGANYVGVTALNEVGDAVGVSNTGPATLGRAVKWRGTTVRALPALGSSSVATDINDRGDAVGYSDTAGGDSHAVLWRGRTVLDVGPAGADSGAIALNEAGQAIGTAYPGPSLDVFRSYRWTP